MKVVIGNNTYSALDNLKFSPQTNLTADQLPINEFEVRLFTNDVIDYGQYAFLYDDLDNLWAKYWISYAERIGQDVDRGTYIVRLIAQSSLAFLERVKLTAKMYNTTASAVLSDILTGAGQSGAITLDTDVATEWASVTIQGFCPEQTARERLQWLLLCAGGYVKSFFDNGIKICKIDLNTNTLIPLEKTYWKPSISHRDYVTQIKITAYEFTQGLPHNYDEYVTDGTNYWVVSKQVITISNNNIPSGVPENIVEISDVMMVSPTVASTIAQNLVAYYFNRMEVDCDVIDNAEYIPGDLVTVYTDEYKLCKGYIDQADFTFGLQARGNLHLTACADVDAALLTIQYQYIWDRDGVYTNENGLIVKKVTFGHKVVNSWGYEFYLGPVVGYIKPGQAPGKMWDIGGDLYAGCLSPGSAYLTIYDGYIYGYGIDISDAGFAGVCPNAGIHGNLGAFVLQQWVKYLKVGKFSTNMDLPVSTVDPLTIEDMTDLVARGNVVNLAKRVYFLPKNYEYEITTEYVDWSMNHHRYIFRPTPKTVSGTLTQNTTKYVECEIALDYYSVESGQQKLNRIDSEYNALYQWLDQYYQPKIREDKKAGESLAKVRNLLQGIYGKKKSLVDEYTYYLHILDVDEAVLDETETERAVDIS